LLREKKVSNPAEGHISHQSPGRLRIKFPEQKGEENFFNKLGKKLLSCPGVQKVEANPSTGSVLLLHESDSRSIVEFARGKKIFHVSEPKKGESPFHQNLISSFAGLNERVKSGMGGQIDLWGVISLLLIGAGIYQVARGNLVAIPWYTALYYGSNILLKSRDGGNE
jgi:hypothetical protein